MEDKIQKSLATTDKKKIMLNVVTSCNTALL